MGWQDNQGVVHPDYADPGTQKAGPQYQSQRGERPGIPEASRTSMPRIAKQQAINHENYQWGGREGGADSDVFNLGRANDAAQTRTGVQIDNYDANEQFANALKARQNQQYLAGQYNQQLTGQGASAAQLGGQQAIDQAISAQMGAGAQGSNQNAIGASQVGAAPMGQQAMMGANAQYAGARGAELVNAIRGYGQTSQQMRGGDLSAMGLHNEQAYRQAQLEAAQKARNDQMAQFYVGQQNDIQGDQLHANEAYQAQRDAEYASAIGDFTREKQRENDQATSAYTNYAGLLGSTFSMGAAKLGDGKDDDNG